MLSSADAAVTARDTTIVVSERAVAVTEFRAAREGPCPSVLLLHGGQGFTPRLAEFERYAAALAEAGFDAYLVNYYSEADLSGIQSGQNPFASRLNAWARLVSDVADALSREARASGAVALVGFSNGGILATAAAALDPRIDAAVVYYGAIPFALKEPVTRLPPVLLLHGDADRVIPLAAGRNLAAKVREIGGTGELVIYQGAGHGFATDGSAAANDALERTIAFLRTQLEAN